MTTNVLLVVAVVFLFGILVAAQGVVQAGPDIPFRPQPPSLRLTRSLASHGPLAPRGIAAIERLTAEQQSYNIIVQVGLTPLRVAIDTGSADAWFVSSACETQQCSSLPSYPLGFASPTFASINGNQTAFAFSFADGTGGSGFVAHETLVVENFTVANQAIGLVQSTNLTLGRGQAGVSGVLGLGFPRLSQIAQLVDNGTGQPVIASLAEAGQLEYPLFGLSLSTDDGSLTLGAIDSNIVTNETDIEWFNVATFPPLPHENASSIYLQWALALSSIDVDNATISVAPTYSNSGSTALALLDAGASGLFGPYPAVEHIFSLIQDSRLVAEGTWAIPCSTTSIIHFSFGGARIALTPEDYIVGEAEGTPGSCIAWPAALPPSPDGIDWQLGAPFLRKVYSIFNLGIAGKSQPLIGLFVRNSTALANGTSSASASSSSSTTSSATASASSTTSASATFTLLSTTLPNSILPTPTFTRPPYLFNTSATPLPSSASMGFGTSTYKVLPSTRLPTTSLSTRTLVTTGADGQTVTTVTVVSPPTGVLGKPIGANAAAVRRHSASRAGWSCVLACFIGMAAAAAW